MRLLQTGSLIAATVTTGMIAGLFAGFAYAVMPGLARTGDRTFVDAMRRVNEAILNGWFMSCFMGALVFTGLAAIVHFRGDDRPALPWVIAGLVLYLAVFVITAAVNVPLNDRLAAADLSGGADGLAAVREQFEAKWVAWNTARAVAATASFGCLVWALVLHGRATAG